MTHPPPRRTGGHSDRSDIDDDAAQSTDYDGGLRGAAEGGRVAMFRSAGNGAGTGNGTGRGAGADRPVSAQPAADVDSPFLGLFDEPPGGRPRDRLRALEPGSSRADRPVSGIPI